jgi:hypothetical protein
MTIAELRELLGHDVLLLGWPLRSKGTKRKWGHLTIADMTPKYLAQLPDGNIGVALGVKSGNLVALDVDTDEMIQPFIAANPSLNDTLQTRGARGRVFWLRMTGDYPRTTKRLETHSGADCGEWRAGQNSQSIVHGIHPNGSAYQVVNMTKPLVLDFASIVWPTQIKNPPRLNSASCVSASLHDCIPASLHTLHNKAESVLANITAKKEAQQALAAKHPNLFRLYTEFIESRFQAQAHARNAFIVHTVPFLYRAVAPAFVLELVGCFYDCNRALFHDPREQHMKEAKAMLDSVAKTYVESLNADERKIYDALPQHEQDAFRICRDLASLAGAKREPNTFFMSFNQLGDRLGIYPMTAQRIMRQLVSYGLIKLVKKGTRRAAGVRGEAGEYQWLLL